MSGPGVQIRAATVAIVGAGPSGLAAARFFQEAGQYTTIDVYEQRPRVGGVWNYDPGTKHGDLPLPQENPDWDVNVNRAPDEHIVPLYDDLETNIPRGLMGFSDLDWPEDCQLFPPHETVLDYIKRYAHPVEHLIRLSTKVTCLKPTSSSSATGWLLTTQGPDSVHTEHHYDAVVVANGHFAVPHLPSVPGLEAWGAAHPGSITHSMLYSSPLPYAGQKVLIIGNGASGTDIATHLLPHTASPLLMSSRSEESYFVPPAGALALPAISHLDPTTRSVHFVSGHVEPAVDRILFCTGYYYSQPFLSSEIVQGGTYVSPLYKHLLLRTRPSLAFLALQQRVIPFPLAEAQASVLARLWAGKISLPSYTDMEAWEKDHLAACERGRDVHVLGYPADADYINEMHDWAAQAGDGGKMALRWGPRERWLRERFPQIKVAFAARGEARKDVRTVEELGFDFEGWKREQEGMDSMLI